MMETKSNSNQKRKFSTQDTSCDKITTIILSCRSFHEVRYSRDNAKFYESSKGAKFMKDHLTIFSPKF
jgi:hypothetical protein